MRVVLICPYSLTLPGGVQGQVLGLARTLRARGISATVLGPCDDGGYYLIGMKRPQPALFTGISWSTVGRTPASGGLGHLSVWLRTQKAKSQPAGVRWDETQGRGRLSEDATAPEIAGAVARLLNQTKKSASAARV